MIYMRNKQTGEIKAVVPQSQEFNQLKKTVDPNGRSWLNAENAASLVACLHEAFGIYVSNYRFDSGG